MARDWLKSLKVLPEDSPALEGKARVYDLALALQDGTVLCNVSIVRIRLPVSALAYTRVESHRELLAD
jgi:hypothetical protein